MAWFRRRREEPTAPAPSPSPVDEPAPFVAPRENQPAAGDWMAMPPMARTVGPPPSRAGNVQRLTDMMTTRRPLALTGTLGHRVSPLAPAGSVEGLATAVDRPVEVDGTGGDLTLRAPAPAPLQREVPVTASATPSLTSITAARLPQPPPARALHEPLPLPGRDVGAENPPRPLAVVQRQPAATAAASTSTSASASASFASAEDAPVGGTPLRPVSAPDASEGGDGGGAPAGVQAGDGTVVELPLAATAASPPIPMEDVMPPIQPRAIQRRAAEAAGASARPETAADAPLPPLPDWARPAQPTGGGPAAPAPSMPLQHPTVQREAAPAGTSAAAAPTAAHTDDAEDADDTAGAGAASAPAPAPTSAGAPAGGGADGQTGAPSSETSGSSNGAGSSDSATPAGPLGGPGLDAGPDASAPLAGDAPPLAATSATDLAADVAGEASDAGRAGGDGLAGGGLDLPLHAAAPPAPAADAAVDNGPPANTWNSPSERMPSDRVPDPEPVADEPAVQRMAGDGAASGEGSNDIAPLLGDRPLTLHAGSTAAGEGAGRDDAGTAASPRAGAGALPLAPDGSSAGGPTLATPPSAASAPSAQPAPSAASVPAAPGRPVGASPSAALSGVQREPLAGATAARAGATNATASTGGIALPLRSLPSVLERPAASPGSGGPLTGPLPVSPPAGAPPLPAMDGPLAFHAIPSMDPAGTATATLPDSATAAALATPVQTLRAPGTTATAGSRPAYATSTAHAAPAAHTAAMPLQAPVQRSADASPGGATSHGAGTGTTTTGASGASPSIGDLAVASGLAVRQPDGSVLFTRQEPPPSADDAPIQRSLGIADAALARGKAGAVAAITDAANAAAGGGGGGGGGGDVPATMPDLDVLARRLLPRFRRLLASEARTGRGRLGEAPWNRH